MVNTIRLKRVYDQAASDDGYRVLVDRLWPRGFTKEQAKLDYWAKEVAPTSNLRKDYHQGAILPEIFRLRYLDELDAGLQQGQSETASFLKLLTETLAKTNVTLLFASKDQERNHAMILRDWLETELQRKREGDGP